MCKRSRTPEWKSGLRGPVTARGWKHIVAVMASACRCLPLAVTLSPFSSFFFYLFLSEFAGDVHVENSKRILSVESGQLSTEDAREARSRVSAGFICVCPSVASGMTLINRRAPGTRVISPLFRRTRRTTHDRPTDGRTDGRRVYRAEAHSRTRRRYNDRDQR